MDEVLCFRCHAPGHRSANCPSRTRSAKAHPPAAPDGPPEKREKTPGPPPVREVLAAITPTEVVGNYRAWAEKIRAEQQWMGSCGDPADLMTTPFRRAARLGPIHQCQLRQLAAQQIRERT